MSERVQRGCEARLFRRLTRRRRPQERPQFCWLPAGEQAGGRLLHRDFPVIDKGGLTGDAQSVLGVVADQEQRQPLLLTKLIDQIQHAETKAGIELLRQATAIEASMPMEFGPPVIVKPSHELFGEALIHATGQIRSDRERCIVIGGYTPPMFQAWNGQEPSESFVAQTPTELKPLISGSDKWHWQQRRRSLDMPVGK